MLTVLLLFFAALQPSSHPPKPAPPVYVTSQFGLAVQIPKGLSYCPLPKYWSGTEDGTVLFLDSPADCVENPTGASSTRRTSTFVPYVALRYRRNVGRKDNFDEVPPAQSTMELAEQVCARPEVSAQFKLLGQPAVSCRSELSGDNVRLVLLSLFDSRKKLLLLDLHTTRQRLTADTKILEALAAAVTECKPTAASNASEKVPPCPDSKPW